MLRPICAAMLLIASMSASHAMARECGLNSLPSIAQLLIKERFPSWNIVDLLDLSSDDKAIWLENYNDRCPGFIEGDFAAPHSLAITLIQPKGKGLLQMLVVLKPSGHSYKIYTLSKPSENAVANVLLKFPPGLYSDAEHAHSVETKTDGVGYIKLESSETLFYLTKGKFESLEISE